MRSALIRGTRVHVRAIVEYWKQGLSIEEILEALPHLRPAQVLDALSYYHDHRATMEREIRDAAIPRVLRRRGMRVARDGKVRDRRAPR